MMSQDALRWDASSVLGMLQRAGPVSDNADRIKKIHDATAKNVKLIDPDTPSASAFAKYKVDQRTKQAKTQKAAATKIQKVTRGYQSRKGKKNTTSPM